MFYVGREANHIPYSITSICLPGTLQSHYSIDDDQVSKLHFCVYSILYDGGPQETQIAGPGSVAPMVYCEDMDSTNGTFVNGTRITTPVLLCHRDVIHIKPRWFFIFGQKECVNPQTALGKGLSFPKDAQQVDEIAVRISGDPFFLSAS